MPTIKSPAKVDYLLETLPKADQSTEETRKEFWDEVSAYWDGYIESVNLDANGRVVYTPRTRQG